MNRFVPLVKQFEEEGEKIPDKLSEPEFADPKKDKSHHRILRADVVFLLGGRGFSRYGTI